MHAYSRTHLSDHALLRDLAAHLAQDRSATAVLLADLAEVDARRLFVPAGYDSMFIYCVEALHLSRDAALRRIRAARAARRFPAIFAALVDGRLNLSSVSLLARRLTRKNAAELLAAAEHKTRYEIEQLLAERFPQPDRPTRVEAIAPPTAPVTASVSLATQPVPAVEQLVPERVEASGQLVPGRVEVMTPSPKVTPLSTGRSEFYFTARQETHELLRYAQSLLGHQIPAGEVAEVFHRGLELLVRQLEKQKFGATDKPRPGQPRSNGGGRYIPAAIRRAVWERDQGQCTFVSETGHRCSARTRLEFDHSAS